MSAQQVRLAVVLKNGELGFRNPKLLSEQAQVASPCRLTGVVELVRDVEWLVVPNLSHYGLSRDDLYRAWTNKQVDVYRLNENGTEEEFFP